MPPVLATPERRDDVDVHALPGVRLGFWRTWAQSIGRPHVQRSRRTLRSCALTGPQTMETLLESVARHDPFLYTQVGSGL